MRIATNTGLVNSFHPFFSWIMLCRLRTNVKDTARKKAMHPIIKAIRALCIRACICRTVNVMNAAKRPKMDIKSFLRSFASRWSSCWTIFLVSGRVVYCAEVVDPAENTGVELPPDADVLAGLLLAVPMVLLPGLGNIHSATLLRIALSMLLSSTRLELQVRQKSLKSKLIHSTGILANDYHYRQAVSAKLDRRKVILQLYAGHANDIEWFRG